jgi:hypothetical protein
MWKMFAVVVNTIFSMFDSWPFYCLHYFCHGSHPCDSMLHIPVSHLHQLNLISESAPQVNTWRIKIWWVRCGCLGGVVHSTKSYHTCWLQIWFTVANFQFVLPELWGAVKWKWVTMHNSHGAQVGNTGICLRHERLVGTRQSTVTTCTLVLRLLCWK